jgi:hypothetical protein
MNLGYRYRRDSTEPDALPDLSDKVLPSKSLPSVSLNVTGIVAFSSLGVYPQPLLLQRHR